MQNYFPYSQIVNLCNNIRQSMSRHAYFGEWNVCETKQSLNLANTPMEISELYY